MNCQNCGKFIDCDEPDDAFILCAACMDEWIEQDVYLDQ